MKILLSCLLCLCIIPFSLTYSEARSETPAEKAVTILNQLVETNDTNIPISGYGILQNGVLFVEIDDRIAKPPYDVYKQRLTDLLGNIPMVVKFGHLVFDVLPSSQIPKGFSLNFSIQSSTSLENSTIRDLHFRFFDVNSTINNVSFFINVTKGNKILMHDFFYTHSGFLTIHIQTKTSKGNWTVFADQDPVLGGWMSTTDDISMIAPVFTEEGLYHFQMEVVALGSVSGDMIDPKNHPKFDSWWFVDGKGNVLQLDISKIPWIENTYEWWLSGQISDQEFTNEIQYLMDSKIIQR